LIFKAKQDCDNNKMKLRDSGIADLGSLDNENEDILQSNKINPL
jgi:hypothetical protein